MTGGIHIRPGSNLTLNGVNIERAVELATIMAKERLVSATTDEIKTVGFLTFTDAEYECAVPGARLLLKMKRKYPKEVCRDALWAKVISEAQLVKAPE